MPNIFCIANIENDESLAPLASENSKVKQYNLTFDSDIFALMKKDYHLYAMDRIIDIPVGDYIAYRLFCYSGKFHASYHDRLLYMVKHGIDRVPMNIGATVIKRVSDGILHTNHIITGDIVLNDEILNSSKDMSDDEIIQSCPLDIIYHPHKKTKPFFYQDESLADIYKYAKEKENFFSHYDPLYIASKKMIDTESIMTVTPIDVLEEFCNNNMDETYVIND